MNALWRAVVLTACFGCAGPDRAWPKADFGTTCTIIDMASLKKTPGEDWFGPINTSLTPASVASIAIMASELVADGMSHESVARDLSWSWELVRFIDSRTLLVVGMGNPTQDPHDRVWLVRL